MPEKKTERYDEGLYEDRVCLLGLLMWIVNPNPEEVALEVAHNDEKD